METVRKRCTDCHFCQTCSKSRCRLCASEIKRPSISELGSEFTYGQYLDWKAKQEACPKSQ